MNIQWRRLVKEDDLLAIRTMVTHTGVFSAEEIDVAVELAQDRLTRGTASDYHFLFAELEGAPVGYTCFGRIPFTDERYDLYWIMVDKGQQKQGIATEMLHKTEAIIISMGGKKLYAETSSRAAYKPAHLFYPNQGLEELARLKDFYSDGDDKILFAKTL